MPKVIPFQISIGAREQRESYSLRAQSNSVEVRAVLTMPDDVFALAVSDMSPVRAEAFGLALGRALFVQPVRDLLLHTAQMLTNQEAYIQIQLRIAAPELVAIPWEWVTLGTTRAWRPATGDDYTLVRVGRHAAPVDPVAVAGPLRVLIAAARGEDQAADMLAHALDSHAAREIAVEVLRHATPATLEQVLGRQKVHILHCVAPVELSQNGTPRVLLGKGVEGFDLARLLADAPRLHLATFTGAHGENGGVMLDAAALAGLTVDEHIPATIAFTSHLPATYATRFAATCYTQLAEGATIDQAVTTGRQALEETGRSWGTPQLWLVPGSERLFNIAGVRPQAANARDAVAGVVERLRSVELAKRPQAAPRRPLRDDAPRSIRRMPLESQNARAAAPRRTARAPFVHQDVSARSRRSFGWTARLAAVTVILCLIVVVVRALRPSSVQSSSAFEPIIPAPLWSTPTPVPPTPTPSTPIPARPPESYVTYETLAGDTFETLADKLNSNALAIADLNHLAPTENMRAGYPLVIPVYKVGVAQTAGLLITHGNLNTPKVALTFDVEIDEQSLYDILDILRQNNIKATFFFPGRWAEAYPNAVKAAVDAGHEVGNHSLTHPFFSRIGLDGALNELQQGESIVKGAGGVTTRPYFRFPYGDSTPQTIALAGQQGYICIHWSADDPAVMGWLRRIAQNPSAGNGGILLMHGRPATVAILPDIIARLKAMGLQPTSLTDALR